MPRPPRTKEENKGHNQRILAALKALKDGTYKNAYAAAVDLELNPKTLCDQWRERQKDPLAAQASHKLLTPAQSDVLDSWCIHLSCAGETLGRTSILPYVKALCHSKPSASWVERYLHNNPLLVTRRPTSLDPKRAQAFNREAVAHHFHLFQSTVTINCIPIKNQY